jgi:hypothetical protein
MSEKLNISISKNEQDSPWVLVNNKNEYINRLIKVLSPSIITGFYSIYNNTKNKNKVHKYLLREFQNELSNTPHWNQLIITGEFERIKKDSGCDWLDNLIRGVFKKYAKTLNVDKGNIRNIKIPNSYEFIHKCYINIAREVWKNPKLFYHKLNNYQIAENTIKITEIVEDSIKDTILELMPLEKFIDDYVSNETMSNSKNNESENETESESGSNNEDIDRLKYDDDESDNNSERSDILSNQDSLIDKLSDKNDFLSNTQKPIHHGNEFKEKFLNNNEYITKAHVNQTNLNSIEEFKLDAEDSISSIIDKNEVNPIIKEEFTPIIQNFTPIVEEEFNSIIQENNPITQKFTPIVEEITPIVEENNPITQNFTPIVEKITPIVEEITPIVEEITPIVEEITPIVEEITPVVDEITPIREEIIPIVEEITLIEEITPIVEEITPIVDNEIIDNVSSSQINTLTNEKIIEINDISLRRSVHSNDDENEDNYEKHKTKKYMNELKLRRNNDKIKNLLGINVDYPTFIKNKEKIKKILLSKSIDSI